MVCWTRSGGKRRRDRPRWPGCPPVCLPVRFLTTGLGAWGGLDDGGREELEAFCPRRAWRSRTVCSNWAMRSSSSAQREQFGTGSLIAPLYQHEAGPIPLAANRLSGYSLSSSAAQAGPISPYYLTAGDQRNNFVVQDHSVINSSPQQYPADGGEYAITVTDTVRTLGNGNPGQRGLGSQYTLGGAYTGVDYPYPPLVASFYDGASDGTFNYSVDFSGGGVYRFDPDWEQLSNVVDGGCLRRLRFAPPHRQPAPRR